MTRVPRHQILLALLTSFDNNDAYIPRITRSELLTNNLRCQPATHEVLVRGHLKMSLFNKTFQCIFAAMIAVATFATVASADPAVNYQAMATPDNDLQSLVTETARYREGHHWAKSFADSVKYSKVTDGRGQKVDGVQSSQVKLSEPKQFNEKVDKGQQDIRVCAAGSLLPDGRFSWDGRAGIIPNPSLTMPGGTSPFKVPDSGYLGIIGPMLDVVSTDHSKRTTSITNGEFAAIMAARTNLVTEMRADPGRWRDAMKASQEAKQQSSANQQAEMAEVSEDCGWDNITFFPLINIANEQVWQPCAADAKFKTYENAAWMVGRMYKEVYIPMAILFLLPGAILTQLKIVVRTGFLFGSNDEDMVSPWSGVMRSMIAVFLIPATQLFMSYTIDVGNSLTYEVCNYKPFYDLQRIKEWRNEQTLNTTANQNRNYIKNLAETQIGGKFKGTKEKDLKTEDQHFVDTTGQQWFNTLSALMGQGMVCLNAFQFVMVLYLFLLGPMAAALFAWPGVARETFRKVFSNWMNGVVHLTLWKFWWSIILLCMSVRLYLYQDAIGSLPPPEDSFEMFTAAAFMAMLMYIPFNPFDFRPGDLVSSVLEKAQQQTSKGGGGAAAVGSAGGAGGGGGSGGGQNAGVSAGVGG